MSNQPSFLSKIKNFFAKQTEADADNMAHFNAEQIAEFIGEKKGQLTQVHLTSAIQRLFEIAYHSDIPEDDRIAAKYFLEAVIKTAEDSARDNPAFLAAANAAVQHSRKMAQNFGVGSVSWAILKAGPKITTDETIRIFLCPDTASSIPSAATSLGKNWVALKPLLLKGILEANPDTTKVDPVIVLGQLAISNDPVVSNILDLQEAAALKNYLADYGSAKATLKQYDLI